MNKDNELIIDSGYKWLNIHLIKIIWNGYYKRCYRTIRECNYNIRYKYLKSLKK